MLEGSVLKSSLLQKILALKGNVSVFCRVRPMIPTDKERWTEFVNDKAAGDLTLRRRKQQILSQNSSPSCIEVLNHSHLVLKTFDLMKIDSGSGLSKMF